MLELCLQSALISLQALGARGLHTKQAAETQCRPPPQDCTERRYSGVGAAPPFHGVAKINAIAKWGMGKKTNKQGDRMQCGLAVFITQRKPEKQSLGVQRAAIAES